MLHVYAEFEDFPLRNAPFRRRPRDAWRNGRYAVESFEISVEIIERLANPARLFEIARDVDRLGLIELSLADRGQDEVLILVVDNLGKIALKDGHHRLLCAKELKWERMACRMVVADRIRSHGIPVHEVLRAIITPM